MFSASPITLVLSLGDDRKQLFNPFASYWRDDTELGQVSADGVDHRSLLADEELSRAVEH